MKKTLLTIAVALLAFPAFAAVHYEYFQRSTSEGSVVPSSDLTARVIVDGMRSRVEFLSGDLYPAGTYVVSSDGSRRLFFVDPAKRWFTEYNTATLTSAIAAANVKIENLQSKTESLPDKPLVAGVPTDHSQMVISYDISVTRRTEPLTQRVKTVIDTWSTTKFGEVSRVAFGSAFQTGNPDLDKVIELETAKIGGFVLRQKVTITMSTTPSVRKSELALAASRTITREMQVTSIREAPADPGVFVVPTDYRRAEQPQVTAPLQTLTMEPTGK